MNAVSSHEERPTILADHLGSSYSAKLEDDHKKLFGQYLTPIAVADFMAGLSNSKLGNHVDVLDPGIGSGVLATAIIEHLTEKNKNISSIKLVGYETDPGLMPINRKSFEYLKKWLLHRGVDFAFDIRLKDFVLDKACVLEDNPTLFTENQKEESFDVIISNPPYFKIAKDDPRARAAARVVYGQPNIYALFMAISARLLKAQGELIFITPRSYASGPYFRSFREFFFSEILPSISSVPLPYRSIRPGCDLAGKHHSPCKAKREKAR